MTARQSLIDKLFEDDTNNDHYVKWKRKKEEVAKQEAIQKKIMKQIQQEKPRPFNYNDYRDHKPFKEYHALSEKQIIETWVENMLLIDQKRMEML